MIQRLNPYGPQIERCILAIVLAIICGALLGVAALELIPQPEMRVLSSYEAMDRGWASQFER